MKKNKLRRLSILIGLCLLITSFFNVGVAQSISEDNQNKEVGDQLSSRSCTTHYWAYYPIFNMQHRKVCKVCGETAYEPHELVYDDRGEQHHKRCTKCSFDVYEDHVSDPNSHYYSDLSNGHYQKCKLCGGNTNTVPHDYLYSGDNKGMHQAHCSKCLYAHWEDHESDGAIYGTDPNKYERCKKCNAYMPLPCTHSEKIYDCDSDTLHKVRCRACNELLTIEQHSYKKIDNGSQNHKLRCKYCPYEKGTEPHNFQWKSDGASGHHKICTGCGRTEGTVSHNLTYTSQGQSTHSAKCQTCSYSITQPHTLDSSNQYCTKCGQSITQCQHNNIDMEPQNDYMHIKVCADCSKELGVEPHNLKTLDLGNGRFQNSCNECGFFKITIGEIPK